MPTCTVVRNCIAVVMLGMATGCGLLAHDAAPVEHGIQGALEGAAHDHVSVHLPHGAPPIDIGGLPQTRLQTFQSKVKEIFGDEVKEDVAVVCKAKELVTAGNASSPDEAVTSALGALGVPSPPPDRVRELAETTQRALAADASPDDMARAASAWACEWAG
jgi:hypothetical protein